MKKLTYILILFGLSAAVSYFSAWIFLDDILRHELLLYVGSNRIVVVILVFSVILTLQNVFTLIWMLFGWSSAENEEKLGPPKDYLPPSLTFTALLPARHEEKVIGDTIESLSKMNYPDELYEVLVLVQDDDLKTLAAVRKKINELGKRNIKLVYFDGLPINKPKSLNIGLEYSKGQVVTIFDAEDDPHPDLFNIVNTIMLKENVDVVQSGVQLMNYDSYWFSTLNVLEYYFWFKSGLHFFTRVCKAAPLGGNSVFFKKRFLQEIGGWDEGCLCEDADIGIRLSSMGAKIRVVYSEKHATREETPHDIGSFIKQRTRWNQGFIQILFKWDWLKMPLLRQKLIAVYLLLSPIVQAVLLVYIPLGVYVAIKQKLPLPIAFFSYLPLYLLMVQITAYIAGIYKFSKEYKTRFSLAIPFKILFTYYPYQFLLVYSAFRSIVRAAFGQSGWEKTVHLNMHRAMEWARK